MKPKIILFLALIISGLSDCLNGAHGQTNPSPQFSKADIEAIRLQAEIGNARAQTRLGMAYLGGDGVPKDPAQSFYWFQKAAEQGDPLAEGGLGTAYINGEGVAKDEKAAFKWFKKAADQDFFAAQDQLGVLYMNGMGVEKDLAEAYKWFTLAAQQGCQTAEEHRSSLTPYLTASQIYEGYQRAKAFVPAPENSTNQLPASGAGSNPAPPATMPKTADEVEAEVRAGYSNFIPMVTNRLGPNLGPVAAQGLATFETNALVALTNSTMQELGMAANFLTQLKKEGRLPGVQKDSHATVTTDTLPLSAIQEAKYLFAATFHVVLAGDSLTNHYIVMRPAKNVAWQLARAWRTDTAGHTVVEWPVK